MDWQTLYILFSAACAALLAGLAYWVWHVPRRGLRGVAAFVILLLITAVYALLYALEQAAPDTASAITWAKLQQIPLAALPPAWLIFTLQYSRRVERPDRRTLALLAAIPAFSSLLALTAEAEWSTLFWSSVTLDTSGLFPVLRPVYGPWFVLSAFYGFALMIASSLLLWRLTLRESLYRRQAIVLVISSLLPWFGLLLETTGMVPAGVELLPLAMAASAFLMTWALLQLGVQEVVPVAYSNVIATMSDGVLIVDTEDRLVLANPAALRLLDLTEEALNRPAAEVLPPGLLEAAPGEAAIGPYLLDVRVSRLDDYRGRPQGQLVVLYDSTARKAAEQARREEERRYRALFDHNHDGVFILDLNMKIRAVNRQGCLMMSRTEEELVGSSGFDHMPRSEHSASKANMRALLSGKPLPIYERTYIRGDGSTFPAEISVTLVRDEAGNPLHLQSIVRDITHRKEFEEALNQRLVQLDILQQVDSEVNSTLDISHVLLVALDAALRLSGGDNGFIALTQEDGSLNVEQIIGPYPTQLLEEPLPSSRGLAARVMKKRQPELIVDVSQDTDYIELVRTTRAVMVIPMISQAKFIGLLNLETRWPDRFTQDTFQFVQILTARIAVAVDNARLYEHVSAQLEELQKLYEQLRALEQLKTDMIRVASHDLKNPLGVLVGYLTLIEYDLSSFSEKHRSYIEAMSRSTQRMQKLVEDILSLERIEQMASSQGQEIFDLREQVQQAITDYIHQARGKSQEILTEIEVKGDTPLRGDSAQIYEALSNLISNAIKYTPEGGCITVRLLQEGSSPILRFEVQDTGYGIPEEQQAKLFQPFFRAHSEETARIEGTGLGLHLVKNIVERHQGRMIFRSVYQQGSTFGFFLPLYQPREHGENGE